mgnify:CR=1 FL=1
MLRTVTLVRSGRGHIGPTNTRDFWDHWEKKEKVKEKRLGKPYEDKNQEQIQNVYKYIEIRVL